MSSHYIKVCVNVGHVPLLNMHFFHAITQPCNHLRCFCFDTQPSMVVAIEIEYVNALTACYIECGLSVLNGFTPPLLGLTCIHVYALFNVR